MRDLETDLNCVTGPVGIMKIKELYAIAEHALNRAITAEAENKKLRRLLELTKRYCIQFDGCQEMDDDCSHECEVDCPFMLIETCRNIRKTITELDKEGEI